MDKRAQEGIRTSALGITSDGLQVRSMALHAIDRDGQTNVFDERLSFGTGDQ